jgi:hypothetical protein
MRVPRTVPARAVLIGNEHARTVQVTKHTLAVALPRPQGVTCQSITFGAATIVLTKAAKLGNPAKAGRYPFVVVHDGLKLTTTLTIR